MKCKITFIANHGVMIENETSKVLVDAIQEGNSEFVKTPVEAINKLEENIDEFKHVDTLLFTHSHIDHFSCRIVADIMKKNTDINTVIDEVGYSMLEEESIINSKRIESIPYRLYQPIELNIKDLKIIALPTSHYGRRESEKYDVPNFSYIIIMPEVKIFISGDGEACETNYEKYTSFLSDIDIAILCFPYIFTTKAQRIVTEFIKPKQIIINHLPGVEFDSYKIRPQLVRYYNKYKELLPKVVIFDKYMDTIDI